MATTTARTAEGTKPRILYSPAEPRQVGNLPPPIVSLILPAWSPYRRFDLRYRPPSAAQGGRTHTGSVRLHSPPRPKRGGRECRRSCHPHSRGPTYQGRTRP